MLYLSQSFHFITNLKKLSLSENNITDTGIKYLCDNLKFIPNLTILVLSRIFLIYLLLIDNQISDFGISHLSHSFSSILSLNKLHLQCIILLILYNR